MTRAALAVMAGLLCGLAGVRRAAALRAEEAELHRWADLLASLALILGEGTLSLPDALLAAADGQAMPDTLLRGMAERMKRDPLTSPYAAYDALAAPSPARETLGRMFMRLGRGTLESRRLAAEQAASAIDLMARQAAQRVQKDAKLFQTLGFTGGAALTLLLL